MFFLEPTGILLHPSQVFNRELTREESEWLLFLFSRFFNAAKPSLRKHSSLEAHLKERQTDSPFQPFCLFQVRTYNSHTAVKIYYGVGFFFVFLLLI